MAPHNEDKKRTLKLSDLDLTKQMSPEEYADKLRELQVDLVKMQRRVVERGARVAFVFEGVDAAGKGGAIRRLTEHLDPRGYEVHAVGAPNEQERGHHWLRRFWVRLPSRGRIAIFDRSWYGRMLVEPIEGFCTREDYKRASSEIREFERVLSDDGYIFDKLFLFVDKDEQLRRFRAREEDPLKGWKITAEDWRNREKFEQYEKYADDMFSATDAPHAPWHLVPGNDKNWARIRVLRTAADALHRLG
jgi:polyphosphate kinase 2 (PPK2 family)